MQKTVYHSQVGQDFLLDTIVFQGLRGGVFVDIGAHDGETFSNSLTFERDRGWTGVCAEPNPAVFRKLAAKRRAACLNVAVGERAGVLPFLLVQGPGEMLSTLHDETDPGQETRVRDEAVAMGGTLRTISVPVRTPEDIFAEHGLREVHLLSVDTEGTEAAILGAIDHARTMVHVVDAECNRKADLPRMTAALGPRFALVGRHRQDLFFINRCSPFIGRLGALRRAILVARLRRTAGKLVRRLIHGPKRRQMA